MHSTSASAARLAANPAKLRLLMQPLLQAFIFLSLLADD
jgi:hypothetical protein